MGKKKKNLPDVAKDPHSQIDGSGYHTEVTQVKKITEEVVHYDLGVEDLPVAPEGAIPYELNLAEMPIFSKNRKVKDAQAMRYVFDEKGNEYLRVVPSGDPELISNKIPQEFDEQVFYGLLRINKKTGNRRIVCDYPSLLKISNLDHRKGQNRLRVKDCLERLTHTAYVFNKCYYDPVARANGADYIKQTKHLHIVSSLETITFEKFREMKNETDKRELSQHFERHGNIEELFVVTLNEALLKNLELKSFKYFQQEDLLEIDNAVARKLYIMLTKWRYWEKKPILTRRVKFLASRIPLSWQPSGIPSTVKSLLHACDELKSSGKITDFVLNKKNGLKTSTIDFHFAKDALEQLNTVYGTETTGHEGMEITRAQEESAEKHVIDITHSSKKITALSAPSTGELPFGNQNNNSPTEHVPDIDRLIALLPDKHREKKTIRKVISDALKKHDFEYIKWNLLYTNKNASGNYRGYFVKALENNYGLGLKEDHHQKVLETKKLEAVTRAEEDKRKAELDEMQLYWKNLSLDDQTEWLEKASRKWKNKSPKVLMGFAVSMAWNAREN